MSQLVSVTPICNAGKNILHGISTRTWNIILERDRVFFSTKPGPWLLISPGNSDSRHMRWAAEYGDEAFSVARSTE